MRYQRAVWLCVVMLLFSAGSLSAEALSAPSDPWIDAGWEILNQADSDSDSSAFDAAIDRWQQGVDQLSPDRILLSPIGFYHSQTRALRSVKRLGAALRGIVLKGRYQGAVTYFVLSAPSAVNRKSLQIHFEQMLSGGKHNVFGWAASRFQRGGSMAPLSTMKTQPHPKESWVVSSKTVSPPRATPEQLAQKLLTMAREAQKRGDRKQAISLLVELLRRTPNHARARLMSGKLMIADGQYDAAWQVMRPLLKPDALDWKPWFWSGTAELMVGKLDDAANHFDEALARDGRVAAVWVQRALVAQERGRYAVAYQLLQVAEAQSPTSVQVMLNLGFTLDAMGKTEAATVYYRRYLVKTAGASGQWRARKSVIERLAALGR